MAKIKINLRDPRLFISICFFFFFQIERRTETIWIIRFLRHALFVRDRDFPSSNTAPFTISIISRSNDHPLSSLNCMLRIVLLEQSFELPEFVVLILTPNATAQSMPIQISRFWSKMQKIVKISVNQTPTDSVRT